MATLLYTARFAGPELFVRGRANVITCPVYRDGALVAPTALGSSVTITRPDQSTLVLAGSVTVVGSIAQYTILAADLAGQLLGEGWRVEWSLVLPDMADPHVFRRSAIVGRSALYPVITDEDLFRRRGDLRGFLGDGESYQGDIEEAFTEICHMLGQGGSLAHLVMDPESLKYVELYKTLAIIYGRFSTAPPGESDANWPDLAATYETRFSESYKTLGVKYDTNDSGVADTKRRAAHPVTFLGVAGDDWGR